MYIMWPNNNNVRWTIFRWIIAYDLFAITTKTVSIGCTECDISSTANAYIMSHHKLDGISIVDDDDDSGVRVLMRPSFLAWCSAEPVRSNCTDTYVVVTTITCSGV